MAQNVILIEITAPPPPPRELNPNGGSFIFHCRMKRGSLGIVVSWINKVNNSSGIMKTDLRCPQCCSQEHSVSFSLSFNSLRRWRECRKRKKPVSYFILKIKELKILWLYLVGAFKLSKCGRRTSWCLFWLALNNSSGNENRFLLLSGSHIPLLCLV